MLLRLFFLDVLIKAAFDHQYGWSLQVSFFTKKARSCCRCPLQIAFSKDLFKDLSEYVITRAQCDKCSAMTPSDKKSKGAKAAPFQRRPLEIIVWLSGHTYISAVIRRIGSSVSPNTIAAIEEKP